jgi:peptide/nickel transport system substrate-binding protein
LHEKSAISVFLHGIFASQDLGWRGRFLTGHARHRAALFAGILCVGCGASGPTESAGQSSALQKGGELIVSVRTEPRSFSTYTSQDATTHLLSLLTQARLVRVNSASQQLEPWLAESWTRSDDGLSYTISLRPGVRFSDGVPLTADDVVFSLAAAYDAGSMISDSLQIDGERLEAAATDSRNVTVTFPRRFGPGLRLLDDLPILPKHKLQAALDAGTFGKAWGLSTPVAELVGLGPFVIEEYRPGQHLVLTRNGHYFRTDASGIRLPYLNRIVVEMVPEQDAQILSLQAGQTDTTASEVRPEDYSPLKRAAEKGALQLLDLGVAVDPDSLWMNLKPGAFDNDPRRSWIQRDELRHAISLAVDRRVFVDTVYLGAATPVSGPITPANKRWHSDHVPQIGHDPSGAKSLLATIGLEDRNADGLLEDRAGRAARFTLLTAKGQTALERGSSVIRDELKKIGLTVDVVTLEGNALVQRFLSGSPYDAVYFHLTTTDTDPALNRDFWMSSGGAHVWHLGQKLPATAWEREIDDLMLRQATALDEEERRRLFIEVQKIFLKHQPMVYFAAPRIFVAASSRMSNLTPAISRPQLLWSADTIVVAPR